MPFSLALWRGLSSTSCTPSSAVSVKVASAFGADAFGLWVLVLF